MQKQILSLQPHLTISPFFSSCVSSSPSPLSSSSSSGSTSGSGVGGGTSSSWLLVLSTSTFCCSSGFSFFILRPLLGVDGGGGDGVFTRDTIWGAGRLAEGTGKLDPFLLAVGWAVEGGESDREKETPPVLERVAGDSLSLENSGGGVVLEADGWGTAKEWPCGAEVEDDEGWGCAVLPFVELCVCRWASSMAVRTSGWLAWCFSRWRARER